MCKGNLPDIASIKKDLSSYTGITLVMHRAVHTVYQGRFPQPVGPHTRTVSPLCIVSEMSSINAAAALKYLKDKCSIRIIHVPF
jgi:hypothetical protein